MRHIIGLRSQSRAGFRPLGARARAAALIRSDDPCRALENSPPLRSRIDELVDELNRHGRLYYLEDRPEISDSEYDAMYRELLALEAKHPDLRRADSPTGRVGAPPGQGFAPVEHRVPMLSLDNAMDATEMLAFDERVRRVLELEDEIEYLAEPKLDGAGIAEPEPSQ